MTEVVCARKFSATIVTRIPRRFRHSAVVSPETPALITSALETGSEELDHTKTTSED
jgi:hypothetical protein